MDSDIGAKSHITWRSSSYCAGGECIEVAVVDDAVLIRASASPDHVIRIAKAEWNALMAGIRSGEFDDLA
jgi:hypothetical protein